MITIRNRVDRKILFYERKYGLIDPKTYRLSNYCTDRIVAVLLKILRTYSKDDGCAFWGMKEDIDFIRVVALKSNINIDNVLFICENRTEIEDFSRDEYSQLNGTLKNKTTIIAVSRRNRYELMRQWFNGVQSKPEFIDLFDLFLFYGIFLVRDLSSYKKKGNGYEFRNYVKNCCKVILFKGLFEGGGDLS